MKKVILSVATVILLSVCDINAQRANVEKQRIVEDPLTIVKTVYPAATNIVNDEGVWNKAVNRKGKLLGYVFNSTEYGKDIKGFKGQVPVLIVTDKNLKIKKVAVFNSQDTPKFLDRIIASGFMNKWNGKNITKAKEVQVDGVTGATYTSRAIIRNVKLISQKASEKK